MQDAPKEVWSIPYVSWHFSKFKIEFFDIFFLLKSQIGFLKFLICDNQALVRCIPIAAVAAHLNLKS